MEDRFQILEKYAEEAMKKIKLLKKENTTLKAQNSRLLEQREVAIEGAKELVGKLHLINS
ncbi:hypothetical protein KAW65_07980 [candidate division WOR-3 bacterium]|nr:hypothetical protein [candidate division WOR-3 bacterium]